MTLCCLGLGSNLKTPTRLLRQAIEVLKKTPRSSLVQTTPLLFTAPWGLQSQPPFCNSLLLMNTSLTPWQLLRHCQQIERQFGRVRKKRWGPRTLDIDILLYGHRRIHSPELTIPHPYIRERDFVLEPLKTLMDQPIYRSMLDLIL